MGRVITILCLLLAFLYFQVDSSWSISSSFLPSSHLCLPDQRAALLEFKSTISLDDCWRDASYPRTNSWNKSIDCCLWDGVSCDKETGYVIGIDLSDSCLNGSLLANNSLFLLHSLQRLDLSHNWLESFPLENSSLFQLQGLRRLNLAYNNFNGSISSELFSQLVSLTHLNLSYCGFSGLIPHEISLLSNLVSLDFSSSSLRFDAQGFDMLARNLTKLRNLYLDNEDMSGVPVTSFLNLTSSLEHLSFSDSELHGEFPSEVFCLPYLQHIDLSSNENLTGYLPKSNLSSALKLLDLHSCSFRGSIPASFGNLTQIIFMDLSVNSFEGPLPNHVSELQLLETFFLFNNFVSGGVPSWLFTLPSLQRLDLSHNNLIGPIDQIPRPNSVEHVILRSNDIHGPLPDSFFDLVNISLLDLSSNNLSGVIKSNMLSKLRSLKDLDLSNNSMLSLSTIDNDGNYSFPVLETVSFSSCNISQFPNFFRTSGLKSLDLSNNKIFGGISTWEVEGWEQLRILNLSYNFLTTLEQFPGKILEVLDLRSNLLQGPIPSTCLNPSPPQFSNLPYPQQRLNHSDPLQSIKAFLISKNKLTGNIPSLICNWRSLQVLDLSKNSLSGTIPDCLGNFSDSLEVMNLQMNKFCGKIPDSFMSNSLANLFLNDNQLEGLVPPSLANCGSLEILNLGNNMLTDTFPHWLASLPNLQVLVLRFNRLHGSLPISPASSDFSKLRIVDLSQNEFDGSLPTKFFRNLKAMKGEISTPSSPWQKRCSINQVYAACTPLSDDFYYQPSVTVTTKGFEIELVKTLTIFRAMDFSNNLFIGQIPEELGELISLQMLNFSHNNFTGPIPASLANLINLESLDLSSNKLGGRIPPQLTNLTFLEVLNLSQNDLVGPIPHGNLFGTFDSDSYSGNSGLCGFPLSKQCGNPPPPPMFKEDEGSGIAFIWKLAMMGYGCGLVLGLSTGYIVFTTGRPWWFVRMVERDLQRNVTRWICRVQGRRN
ncbi:hypothetical protein PTKIN_Ptkin14bG0116500 [Pterospermum kingtungense]